MRSLLTSYSDRVTRISTSQRGSALVGLLVVTMVVMSFIAISVQQSLTRNRALADQYVEHELREIAESAASQALARVKRGGLTAPHSGNGLFAEWTSFGDGDFYYDSTYDLLSQTTTVRVWARMATSEKTSSTTVSPDDGSWDGTGWDTYGLEVSIVGEKNIPQAPMYFGNGGIEKPLGGFDWGKGVDPADPSTWIPSKNASSSQSSWVPFKIDARDHPYDFLVNGGSPAPVGLSLADALLSLTPAKTHPYAIWSSQTTIGQFNTEAWFANSAGVGSDPTSTLAPLPSSGMYVVDDPTSEDYPYPVSTNLADVQAYAWALWSKYSSEPDTYSLGPGQHEGQLGTLADPRISFVTGHLTVAASKKLEGVGILVIRDDYDPNYDTKNTPSRGASLTVNGELEWTGLVIVAGWAPTIRVNNSGSFKIVGSLYGEDSVQSGGEVSLDSATIILDVRGPLEIYYSSELFEPGGLIDPFMPSTTKRIVGMREIKK